MIAVCFWSLLTPAQEEPATDPRSRIEAAVHESFLGVGATRRRSYVDRLMAALAGARTPSQISIVVDSLPHTIRSHSQQIQSCVPSEINDQADLIVEGYDLVVEYLAAHVEIYLDRVNRPEVRTALQRQLDEIISESEAILSAVFLGPAAENFLRENLRAMRDSILEGFDRPFVPGAQGPLPPDMASSILRGLRAAVSRISPAPVILEDPVPSPRRRTIGIEGALDELKRSLQTAQRAADPLLAHYEAKRRRWGERIDQALAAKRTVELDSIRRSVRRRSSVPSPTEINDGHPMSETRPGSAFSQRRVSSTPPPQDRRASGLLLLVVILAATVIFSRLRQ
jgi:hypothetical protein